MNFHYHRAFYYISIYYALVFDIIKSKGIIIYNSIVVEAEITE